MKSWTIATLLVLLALPDVHASEMAVSSNTIITTSTSTFVLTPPESIVSEEGLKSAGRTAEIAAGEILPVIREHVKKGETLKKELADFEKIKADGQTALNKIKRKYDAELAEYEKRRAQLAADIQAFNALPESQRDAQTHGQLVRRKAALDKERERLEAEKSRGDKAIAEIVSNVDAIRIPLKNKLDLWRSSGSPKLGLAYRQLKTVAEYARQINLALKKRYPRSGDPKWTHPGFNHDGKYPVLNDAMEQIKALSAQGFDT